MKYRVNFKKWFESEIANEESRNELLVTQDNNSEIKERFNKNLDLGTGSFQKIIGVGKNGINLYIARKVTQELVSIIKLSYSDNSSNSEV